MENIKSKELFKNIVVFGIGTFGSKAMQILLVPLYTSYMTTGEFGVADIIMSTLSLLSPFFLLGIGNAIVPFVLGKNQNTKSVLKISFSICLLGTAFIISLVSLFDFKIFGQYEYLIPILFFTSAVKGILYEFCKAIEKNEIYAIAGIIEVLVITILSVLFLAMFEWGVLGYLLALLISYCVIILFFIVTCPVIQTLRGAVYNVDLNKQILSYTIPLIPNELSWWGLQMSDRYMITFFCGNELNGLYSMAYKIPGIFNLVVSVFIKAFGITAIKECDVDKYDGKKYDGKYFSQIYDIYMSVTFLTVVIVIFISKPIATLFFQRDFYLSWVYVPLLLCAYAIGNLQAFYGSLYSGIRRSGPAALSTFIGMVINMILNLILIPKYGAYGAAIATVVGYFFVYWVRTFCIKKYIIMKHYEIKVLISIILVLLISILYINGSLRALLLSVTLYGLLIVIHRKCIKELLSKFKIIMRLCKNKIWK